MSGHTPPVDGLLSQRSIQLSDVPTKGSSRARKPSVTTQAVLDFVGSHSEVEAYEFADIERARKFSSAAAAYIYYRRRLNNEELPARVKIHGTSVYLIRKAEGTDQ